MVRHLDDNQASEWVNTWVGKRYLVSLSPVVAIFREAMLNRFTIRGNIRHNLRVNRMVSEFQFQNLLTLVLEDVLSNEPTAAAYDLLIELNLRPKEISEMITAAEEHIRHQIRAFVPYVVFGDLDNDRQFLQCTVTPTCDMLMIYGVNLLLGDPRGMYYSPNQGTGSGMPVT